MRSFMVVAVLGILVLVGAIAVLVAGIDSAGQAAVFSGLVGFGGLALWAGLRGRSKINQKIHRLESGAPTEAKS